MCNVFLCKRLGGRQATICPFSVTGIHITLTYSPGKTLSVEIPYTVRCKRAGERENNPNKLPFASIF